VVNGAEKLEVVHERNTYEAELIGVDPSSDLAVIKINGSGFPAIKTGVSKNVKVGQWVLAIGNPFNLTSTVTAGIVSAKGRDLNILEDKFPIESFIQTDAAINPGNSGGALVNTAGELIGINTAIISRTGSYAGYGFAVPIDIVNKVVTDLIEYGEVQKAFIGANVTDLTSETIENLDLDIATSTRGVVINQIQRDGAAEKAGLEEKDIIVGIDGESIVSRSDFDEIISYQSPGNIIGIEILRKNKPMTMKVTLTNREGTTSILKRQIYASEYLGADLEAVSKVERDMLEITYGVKVLKVYSLGLMSDLGLSAGFIITDINYNEIKSPEDLSQALSNYRGRVRMEGIDATGRRGYYTFYLR
jgi:S1-C subfamily serine protease